MRRKHRRIQYYSGEPTRGRLRDKIWFPFAVIAAAALILALIVGAILGNVAEKSRFSSGVRKDLGAYGGVDVSLSKYGDLLPIEGGTVTLDGAEKSSLRNDIVSLGEGNAAGFVLYDGQGTVYFDSAWNDKSAESLFVRSDLSADEIADACRDTETYSVGYFTAGAFDETDDQLRLLKIAREMALLCELAESGIREIVIAGLPSDSDDAPAVSSYMRQASEVCGDMILGVVIPFADVTSSGITRLVASTNAYADSYFLDLGQSSAEDIGKALEKNAYFLTAYNMRLLLNGTEKEDALAAVSVYGIESYLFR